jgi:hypothetical protein
MESCIQGMIAFYVLIILAIVIGLTGIALLIVGLVIKKQPIWISGIIGFVLAIIIVAFSIISSFSKIVHWLEGKGGHNTYQNYDQPEVNDTTNKTVALDTAKAHEISGFIQGKNNSSVFIKISASDVADQKGIELVKIEKPAATPANKKVISVKINFNKEYNGTIQLRALDSGNKMIAQAEMKMNVRTSKGYIIDFYFPGTTNFSLIDHCILTEK